MREDDRINAVDAMLPEQLDALQCPALVRCHIPRTLPQHTHLLPKRLAAINEDMPVPPPIVSAPARPHSRAPNTTHLHRPSSPRLRTTHPTLARTFRCPPGVLSAVSLQHLHAISRISRAETRHVAEGRAAEVPVPRRMSSRCAGGEEGEAGTGMEAAWVLRLRVMLATGLQ